jgi:cytidylate kinase
MRSSLARMIIAIDGPAAAGKGTIAARLADRYRLPHLDTGLLYRLVGRVMSERGFDVDDPKTAGAVAAALDVGRLSDPTLRGHEAGELASRVAVHPAVRAALLQFQRDFARRAGGAVLDGRDIGTAVVPKADVKIYVTASPEERARRRTAELNAKGRNVAYETILSEIRARDARDSGRSAAPLAIAADAHLLDTTDMDIEAAFRAAVDIVERARAGRE